MSRTATFLILCSATLLAGCGGKYNPFAEKDKILPGERRPVFEQGSNFEGPRKLPPPNSDYVGATMRADQIVAPASQAPAEPLPPIAPAPAGKKAAPVAVPPPPQ